MKATAPVWQDKQLTDEGLERVSEAEFVGLTKLSRPAALGDATALAFEDGSYFESSVHLLSWS